MAMVQNKCPSLRREGSATPNDRLRDIWNRTHGRGHTQEQAALLMGYESQGAVSHYLTGKNQVNTDAAIRFSRLLHVQPGEIDPNLSDLSLIHSGAEEYLLSLLSDVYESPIERSKTFRRIRARVKSSGLKDVDIAKAFDISSTAVGKWFREEHIPMDRVIRLPRLLGCSLVDLLTEKGSWTENKDPDNVVQVGYSEDSLMSALIKTVGRGVLAEIGVLNSLNEAAIRMVIDGGQDNDSNRIIASALRDAREKGALCYSKKSQHPELGRH